MPRMMRCDLILGSSLGGCVGTSCAEWAEQGMVAGTQLWCPEATLGSEASRDVTTPIFSRSSSIGRRQLGPQQTDNMSKTCIANPTLCSFRGVEARNNGVRALK